MSILSKITNDKHREVALKRELVPIPQLEKNSLFAREPLSLSQALKNSANGIIAEHKRRSPSKSVINQDHSVQEVVKGYEKAGVAGISVLTDQKYFGGSLEDLLLARATVDIPILRKEFIIDEYQLIEAKAHGADAVLLIAATLEPSSIRNFASLANALGLEVLLEIHNEKELEANMEVPVHLIGVNNRNLKTFEVTIETSKQLSGKIPSHVVKLSESGISEPQTVQELRQFGYDGFLIGETFMKTRDPGEEALQFIKSIES